MYSVTHPNGEPFFPLSLVDYRAAYDPDTPWAYVPSSEYDYSHGFDTIAYLDLQNAVDGASSWLQTRTGPREYRDTIAYFGLWDPRYVFLMLGASKAGYQIVFPSPNYSLDTLNKILVEDLGCKLVVTAAEPSQVVKDFVSVNGLQHYRCPPQGYFLVQKHQHIAYEKTYEAAADETLIIMHTSGSTRDPKPVVWTNRWAASYFRQNLLEPPKGFVSIDRIYHETSLVSMMPPLHCGSFFGHIFASLGTKTSMYYPLPKSIVSLNTFVDLINHVDAEVAVIPSVIAEIVGANPDLTAQLARRLAYIGYAGGSVSEDAGNRLSEAVKLFQVFGSTENGLWPTIRPDDEWDRTRWREILLHPESSIHFEDLGHARHEAVIKSAVGLSRHDPRVPPALQAFPQLQQWRTNDVFTPSPSEIGAWRFSSRIEDVIRFTDGSIFNPLPYEERIRSHPRIAAALLFGLLKPGAVLLIEPSPASQDDQTQNEALIESIWPVIEQANEDAAGNCTVKKCHIIVTRPGRELPRAYKGTVQRGKARDMYSSEILEKLQMTE